MNEFRRDLEWSHGQSDQSWWEHVYRQAFPDFSTMHDVRKDGWAQRGGIDRQVILTDGTVLKVDEKARRSTYSDILLEYYSDEARKVPGWMAKPLTCDYIAYAFVPSRTCHLLPYQLLRKVWHEHRNEWSRRYRTIRAENPGYTTVSIAVPIPVVIGALTESMTVTWSLEAEVA